MTKTITEGRFQGVKALGMGVVTNTNYVRCFWPRFDEPTELFDVGSSGLTVEGPPTPRNILFPLDTVFINNTRKDCHYFRETTPGGIEMIAELSLADAKTIPAANSIAKDALKASSWFVKSTDSPLDPTTTFYKKVGGVMTVTVKV